MDVFPEQSQTEDWRAFYDTAENCTMVQQEQFYHWELLVVTEKSFIMVTQKL